MVSEIMNWWRGTPLMKKALAEFGDMLNNDEYLFSHAWEGLTTQSAIDGIPQSFYDKVKASGYKRVLSPLRKRSWGLTDFRITDPDGYYLRITSR